MRKIKIIEHISLDGVIQAPGGPEEDPNGFAHGGWSAPHADPEGGKAIMAAHGEAFDLLLGRRTYDIFAGYWPKAPKSPMADGLNAATKYVATHRPKTLAWDRPKTLVRTLSRAFAVSRQMALVSTKAVSSGVIISTYRPNGPLRTGTMGDAAE